MSWSRQLGGFIRVGATEKSMLEGKDEGWAESVGTISGVAHKHPLSAYTGLQKSLHHNWSFVQWVTMGRGYALGPLYKALQDTLLPDLFQGLGEGAPRIGVTCLSVKRGERPFWNQRKRPLKIGGRPVSSQDTSLQRLGARWSSGQRTTWPASKREGRWFGGGAPRRHGNPWR